MNPAGLFNQTVTIKDPSYTQAADGSVGWTLSGTDAIKCSIQPLSSTESIEMERQTSGVFARMYCGLDAIVSYNLEKGSEIVDADGVTWRVAGHPRNTGGRSVFLTVDLERTK
jgi:hypothetical protein